MFEKENRFYDENEEELLKLYEGRWLVIVGNHLDADFSSSEAGYYYGIAKHGEGNFMLRHCVEDRRIIMNRVVFRHECDKQRRLDDFQSGRQNFAVFPDSSG